MNARILQRFPGLEPSGRKRYPVKARVELESLEGRALLSHVHPVAHHPVADVQPGLPMPVPMPHPGPVLDLSGIGYAVKSPRFYPFYSGPRLAATNAAAAKAFVNSQGNVELVGIVVGPLDPAPKTDTESYVFEIDRGTGASISPFPGRPRISFDALVSVDITPTGVTGSFIDLTNNTSTALTPDQIFVSPGNKIAAPNDIHVFLPQAQLYATGGSVATTTVNFSGLDIPLNPGIGYGNFTSFASDHHNFRLSPGPIHHQG
jgi:hypothetical protein